MVTSIENKAEFPAPKFAFGDMVQFLYRNDAYQGIVVGLKYKSPVRALKERSKCQGWFYQISMVDGIPLEQVVDFEGETVYEVRESEEGFTKVMTDLTSEMDSIREAMAV